MNNKIFSRLIDGECVQTAKIRLLGIGKYGFETSLFGKKPYELNMNMPLFDSIKDAVKWISESGKWK